MYAHVCVPYVGVEFRNGVMYVRQRARSRPMVSPMWVTYIEGRSPAATSRKLCIQSRMEDFRQRTREREREGGIRGRFKITITASSDISSPFLARATSREQTCRAPDFLFFSLFFHPSTLLHYPRSFGTTSCHLRAGHIFPAG